MTGSWTLLRGGDPCPKKLRTIWKAMTSSWLDWLGDGPMASIRPLKFGWATVAVGTQTLAFSSKVSSSVRFWYGVEWEIRTKPSQFHTRCTARVRGKDCLFCRFIYPLTRKRWAEPNGIQPIRIQDACSGVCYVGGAFPESRLQRSGSNQFQPDLLT